ncbi:hypothetical protein NG754_10785 [Aliarcobacter cryaerophilus]|uniref:beta strand repeat-containing protein n=1 Tax=Aliarcobacter cryaerophilus TaxID=28198 RepID=UPI003DA260EA
MKGATGGLDLSFAAAAVAGTDTVKVTLDGTTSGVLSVDTTNSNVENVVLTTKNSAATLTSFGAGTKGATTVTIKGGQGFKLLDSTKGFENATTIDAREAGKAEFTSSAAPAVGGVAILTGASDDKITKTNTLTTNDLINLGAGNDTLVLNAAANLAATLIGVENVTLKATNSSIDMTKADQKAALTFEAGGTIDAKGLAAGSTVTSTKVAAGTTVDVAFRDSVMGEKSTIDLQEGTSAASTVTLKNIKDATINFGKATGGASTTIALDASNANGSEVTTDLTVNAKGGALTGLTLATAGELKNLTLNATAGTIGAAAITGVNKLDTLVVNATKDVTLTGISSANTAAMTKIELNATGGEITTGTIANTAAIANAGSIKDVTVTGTKDVTAIFNLTSGNVDKLVSTSTGKTDITITNKGTANEAGSTVTLGNAGIGKTNILKINGDQKQSVIGGTGVDHVTVSGKGASTITLGAGDDELTVDSGSINTITLGAGKDVVNIVATKSGTADAATLAQKHTIITDFKGATEGDTIKAVALKAVDLSGAGVGSLKGTDKGLIQDWGKTITTLEDKITAVATDIKVAGQSVAFVHEDKTFVWIEGATAGAGVQDDDTLIELTGILATTGIYDNGSNVITNIA